MDRGLLLSLMAFEKEFVTEQQFLTAFQASVSNRFLKLEEILIQRGFLTKSQQQRLSMTLQSNLESCGGQWQHLIHENKAVASVYEGMLRLAGNNSAVLEMIEMIGHAVKTAPESNPLQEMKRRIDSHSDKDPHSTISLESNLDPYATIAQPLDENDA